MNDTQEKKATSHNTMNVKHELALEKVHTGKINGSYE